MKIDYEYLRRLAKETGKQRDELIALAPQNDPFYSGKKSDRIQAEWFAKLWNAAPFVAYRGGAPAHTRKLHYWLVGQDPLILMPNGMPYQNTKECQDFLSLPSQHARYLGLIGMDEIVDHKNPAPHIFANYNGGWQEAEYAVESPELTNPDISVWGLNNLDVQPYHLEIWIEKSTQNDILLPLCKEYNANLCTFEGEVSTTSDYQLTRRIESSGAKPTRIFYISDFDPAGNNMPVAMARKLEWMLQEYDHGDWDVKVKHIMLTAQQVKKYRLPRIPIKESELRKARFEEAFGENAVELDALAAATKHPHAFEEIVRSELDPYYSREAAAEVETQEDSLREAISDQLESITSRYQEEIAALKAMQEEIAAIDVVADDYEVHPYEADVEEDDDDWLFSSQRGYEEQLAKYRAHKRRSN